MTASTCVSWTSNARGEPGEEGVVGRCARRAPCRSRGRAGCVAPRRRAPARSSGARSRCRGAASGRRRCRRTSSSARSIQGARSVTLRARARHDEGVGVPRTGQRRGRRAGRRPPSARPRRPRARPDEALEVAAPARDVRKGLARDEDERCASGDAAVCASAGHVATVTRWGRASRSRASPAFLQ